MSRLDFRIKDLGDIVIASASNDMNAPVGSASLVKSTKSIGSVWVDNDYRRQGVASRLLEMLEDAAQEADINSIQFFTHRDNINMAALGEKCGYKQWLVYEKKLL